MKQSSNHDIAVVGLSALFAKSRNYFEYWHNIISDTSCITDVPSSHWSVQDHYSADKSKTDKAYAKKGAFIPNVEVDLVECGLPPTIVEVIDTSQLLSVQLAKEALQDAGYMEGSRASFDRERTGVVVAYNAVSALTEHWWSRLQVPKLTRLFENAGLSQADISTIINRYLATYHEWQEASFPGYLANIMSGRIANRLDLNGINYIVGAACGSSLAAIRAASLELNSHACDMIVTGAVGADNSLTAYLSFSRTNAMTQKDFCAPFDKDADGILLGEGIGFVVLKRLEDAKRDQNKIYGVIKAIGAGSDGKAKSIYAPLEKGQVLAMKNAFSQVPIKPSSIDLIEAHGTGTIAGDATELNSLREFFGKISDAEFDLGSVKSQIGHTRTAAGMASFIKILLSLYYKIKPRTSHVKSPHPNLAAPFYLNTRNLPWFSNKNEPRRACINSFGFGGTNFHMILEEFVEKDESRRHDLVSSPALLFFSSSTMEALLVHCEQTLSQFMSDEGIVCYQAFCASFQENLDHPIRLAIAAKGFEHSIACLQEVIEALKQNNTDLKNPSIHLRNNSMDRPIKLALLFPGQGSQALDMGCELLLRFPEFQSVFKLLDEKLIAQGLNSCISTIYPKTKFQESQKNSDVKRLNQTDSAQPALAVIAHLYLGLLQKANIQADAALGHSFGELSALYAADVFEESEFLDTVIARGKILKAAHSVSNETGMLAVFCDQDTLATTVTLDDDVSIANINSPKQLVLSGAIEKLNSLIVMLQSQQIRSVLLPVSGAFHCRYVASAGEQFCDFLKSMTMHTPKFSVYANSTSLPYPASAKQQNNRKKILSDQIVSTVNFEKTINTMLDDGITTFVEVGPKGVLTQFCRDIVATRDDLHENDVHCVALNQSIGGELQGFYNGLAALWSFGLSVDPGYFQPNDFHPSILKNKSAKFLVSINGAPYLSDQTRQAFMNAETEKSMRSSEDRTITSSISLPTEIAKVQHAFMDNQNALMSLLTSLDSENTATQFESITRLQRDQVLIHEKFLDYHQSLLGGGYESFNDRQEPLVSQAQSSDMLDSNEMSAKVHPQADHSVDVAQTVMSIVSSITGYPEEMLDQDLNMESELGIDSIKRAEIFAKLQQSYPSLANQELATTTIDVQTIQDLVTIAAQAASQQLTEQDENVLDVESPLLKQAVGDECESLVLTAVHEITGYPLSMLSLELEMESELGIDSIKRAEIFAKLQSIHAELAQQDLVATLDVNTLDDLVNLVRKQKSPKQSNEASFEFEQDVKTPISLDEGCFATLKKVTKKVDPAIHFNWQAQKNWCLLDCDSVFGDALVAALNMKNQNASAHHFNTAITDLSIDFSTVDCFVICLPEVDSSVEDVNLINQEDLNLLKSIYHFASLLQSQYGINDSGSEKHFIISGLNISHNSVLSGLSGLCRILSREWPSVNCRFVSLDAISVDQAVKRILAEFVYSESANAAVYYENNNKLVKEISIMDNLSKNTMEITKSDVVLAIGGARGITSQCCLEIAKHSPCAFVLIGKTNLALGEFSDLKFINKDIWQEKIYELLGQSGRRVTPMDVVKVEKHIQAVLEIESTLKALEDAGCQAAYYSCDITDKAGLAAVMDQYQQQYGPASIVIHGAGNIADKRIDQKTEEDLSQVLDPKVIGLYNMLNLKIMTENTKRIILFSSISSLLGNVGQSDYAVANEILNTAANVLNSKFSYPVTSICWGAWDAGMVNPSLREQFKKRGIALLHAQQGAKLFWQILHNNMPQIIADKKSNLMARFKEYELIHE